jgi:hypothetical protein
MDSSKQGGVDYECEISDTSLFMHGDTTSAGNRKIVDMNAKRVFSKIGSVRIATASLGMLAALPVQAGSGLIKVTHSDTPYRGGYQTAPLSVARAGSTVIQTTPNEVQVAVMANAPTQPGAKRSVFIHR